MTSGVDAAAPRTSIPRLIHQMWRTRDLPQPYRALQRSWLDRNPGWRYMLWDDVTLDRFVQQYYPSLHAMFRAYPKAVSRADVGRYLVLRHFGGVYADLDYECLRPLGDRLAGHELVLGVEPASHVALDAARSRGLSRIVCNAFIASVVRHPFWDAVIDVLPQAGANPDVLDATGPFLLTRLLEAHAQRVSVLDADTLYPVDKFACWDGRLFDLAFFEAHTRSAWGLHYWDGSWFRRDAGALPALPSPAAPDAPPRVKRISGVMIVDRHAPADIRRTLDSWRRQDWPDRELLVIDLRGRLDTRLIDVHVGPMDVHLLRMAPGAARRPALLRACDAATGDHLVLWTCGDVSDPARLTRQAHALAAERTAASALRSCVLAIDDPRQPQVLVSERQVRARTLMCERWRLRAALDALHTSDAPDAPDALEATEIDTPRLWHEVRKHTPVAELDLHRLMFRWLPGARPERMARLRASARLSLSGARARSVLCELDKRLALRDPALHRPLAGAPAVLLAGHFGSATGLGAAARGSAQALRAAGIPYTLRNLTQDETVPVAPPATGEAGTPNIVLVHTNPDALLEALASGDDLPRESLAGGHRIGYWAWEAPTGLPATFRRALAHFDEIWAPSRFVRDALAAEIDRPLWIIPHAVEVAPPAHDRAALGLCERAFVFLFCFDAMSNVSRKNPQGLIAAYRAAFAQPQARVRLLIKARRLDAATHRMLVGLIGGRPDIELLSEDLDEARLNALIAACDCYVSLHRGEGFGLTLAQAMAHGRPVIATAWSGNQDFMTPDNSLPVAATVSILEQRDGYYEAGTPWAEPDLAQAADHLRWVVAHRDEAAALGRRARETVRAQLSPAAVGRRIAERLAMLTPRSAAPVVPRRPRRVAPKVLVLTPVKDGAPFLPRHAELIERLAGERAEISLGILHGDSEDRTAQCVAALRPRLEAACTRVEILQHDFGLRLDGPRWLPRLQRIRRSVLARARNRLLAGALRDERWVLWLDVDVTDVPPNLIARLLDADRRIVVPRCDLPDGRVFDLNTFILDPLRGDAEDPSHLIDGLYQPPRGVGRRYLDEVDDADPVRVDGVGGTVLLVDAELHRDGLLFPVVPHRGYIETEGLAMAARDLGVRVGRDSCKKQPKAR